MATELITPTQGAVKIDTGNATVNQANTMQNNANLMAQYGQGNYNIGADGSVTPKTSPVAIVTSNKSKTQYNDNVSTMNTANTALKNSIQAEIDRLQGQMTNANKAGHGAGGANAGQDVPDSVLNGGSNTTDGSTTITGSNGNVYTVPPGMDPTIANSMVGNLDAATSEIQGYRDQISTLGNYDVNTDPVAVAAANSIRNSYDVLIRQMGEKNKMLMGGIKVNAARGGMMQYGNEMDSMFKNAEFDKATQRIADLEQKKMDAINKSNQAYKDGNVKALDQASKELNESQKEARQALLDLQTKINDQVKSNQAQAKIDADNIKTEQALDISASNAIAQGVLDDIELSGVTDQAQIDAYIEQVAFENGITNPAILKGRITALNPQSGTAYLKNQNIISQMNKRIAGDNDTETKNDKLVAEINSLIKNNNLKGKDPDGKERVSWESYRDMLLTWINNDGVESEFYINYPVNVWLDKNNQKDFSENVKKLKDEEDTIIFK